MRSEIGRSLISLGRVHSNATSKELAQALAVWNIALHVLDRCADPGRMASVNFELGGALIAKLQQSGASANISVSLTSQHFGSPRELTLLKALEQPGSGLGTINWNSQQIHRMAGYYLKNCLALLGKSNTYAKGAAEYAKECSSMLEVLSKIKNT